MAYPQVEKKSIGDKLQSVPKGVIYLLLLLCTSLPLFFTVPLPNKPSDASIDFYAFIQNIPDGSRVLIGSDWTKSTRGESMGEMEAVLKLLMRKKIKFAVYSTGDAQAPQVARDTIRRVSDLVKVDGYEEYQPFRDYVVLGYFPNSEGTTNAINNNVLVAFKGKTDAAPGQGPQDVMTSPVFQGVKSLSDFSALILLTASNTEKTTIQRIKKTPLLFMVTGVMVPEDQVYYASGQLKGLVGGIKGVFDIETLMDKGISPANTTTKDAIMSDKYPNGVPGYPGKGNQGKGTAYFLTLHFALSLLIIAVVIGNVGMFLSRRKAK